MNLPLTNLCSPSARSETAARYLKYSVGKLALAALSISLAALPPVPAWTQGIQVTSEHKDVDGDGDKDNADLAQQLSNPVEALISVPIQANWDTGFGPKNADTITVNIQPVIPFRLNEDWNLISRTILPVRWRDTPADGVDSAFGLGDTVQSLFLSPVKPVGGLILGAGPVALLPTGTDPAFQSRELGLGPTGVVLRQHDGWTYGALANHIWGVTNPDDRDQVNATFLQPFVSYTFPTATTLSLNTETTYDWNKEQWTIPINALVSQLVSIGDQKVSFQLGGRYYAEAPSGGPEWGARFNMTLLFPK